MAGRVQTTAGRSRAGGRDFALFLAAYAVSTAGSSIVPVALSFAIFARGGGTEAVSLVLAAETAPLVAFLLLGGAVADRWPKRQVLVAADLLRFAAQALLAVLFARGLAPLGAIAALAAVIGVGTAFFMPGRPAMIAAIVPEPARQSANGTLSVVTAAAGIAGPPLGGLLVGTLGAPSAIAADALTYAVSAACLWLIRAPVHVPPPEETLLRQLAAGWEALRARTWLWLLVLDAGIFNAFVYGPLEVLGARTFAHLPHGATRWGALLGASAAGGVVGGLAAMRWRPRRPLQAGLLVFLPFTLAPLAVVLRAPDPVALAGFAAAGIAAAIYNVLWETTLQREIPAGLLSRVAAYDQLGSLCLLPVGYLVAGPMAWAFGLRGALALVVALGVVVSVAPLFSRSVRRLTEEG